MPLLNSPTVARFPILFSSPSKPRALHMEGFGLREKNIYIQRITVRRFARNLDFLISAAAGESGPSVEFDFPFPSDYTELLQQAKEATKLALKNNKQLMSL